MQNVCRLVGRSVGATPKHAAAAWENPVCMKHAFVNYFSRAIATLGMQMSLDWLNSQVRTTLKYAAATSENRLCKTHAFGNHF